jgi:hypothetical protein
MSTHKPPPPKIRRLFKLNKPDLPSKSDVNWSKAPAYKVAKCICNLPKELLSMNLNIPKMKLCSPDIKMYKPCPHQINL